MNKHMSTQWGILYDSIYPKFLKWQNSVETEGEPWLPKAEEGNGS